jgi:hypothetical protein
MYRSYKILIFSFLLLNLYTIMPTLEFTYGIPNLIKYVISFFVLSNIIYNKFSHPSKPVLEGLYYPVIIIFILWSLILLITSCLKFDSIFYIQRVFAQPYFFIPYLLPVFLLYTRFDLEFFSYLFYYSFLFIIPSLIIQLFIIATSISTSMWLEQVGYILIFNVGTSFLLLTAHISKKKYIFYIVLFYSLLWVFMWSFYGRRGMLIESIVLLVFMIIIRLRSPFLKLADRFKIYYSILILTILMLIFGYLFTSSFAFQRGFSRDAYESSRGVVFADFFSDFSSATDWVFGRGLTGTVLRSLNEEGTGESIENGFLTVLLKGGLLYLIPFLMILLRASFLGFFRSNNDLVKAMASVILIFVMMMAFFNVPNFGTQYILVWIFASACFTKKIRNYSNEEVSQAINYRNNLIETKI